VENICQACGYQRKPTDQAPDWECPSCGKAYAKTSYGSSGSLSGETVSIRPSTMARPDERLAYQAKRFSGATYMLIGIFAFALAFLAETLMVPRLVPTPTLADFNHPYELTGRFGSHRASRGQSGAWVNSTALFCVASATDFYSCLGRMKTLPQGTPITVEFVDLKMQGDMPIVMSIKATGMDVFSQTPAEFIAAWRSLNTYWFSMGALIFAILVVGFTYITKTTDWHALKEEMAKP
jgi:hypothetical protein